MSSPPAAIKTESKSDEAHHAQWYYTDNKKKTCGPVDILQLYTLYQTNVIKENTFIWNPIIIRIWAPLRSITKLYTVLKRENVDEETLKKDLEVGLSEMNELYSSLKIRHSTSENIQLHASTLPMNGKHVSYHSTNSVHYVLLKQDSSQTPITPDSHPRKWSLSEVSDEFIESKVAAEDTVSEQIKVMRRESLLPPDTPPMIDNKFVITKEENKAINSLHKRYTKTNKMIKIFESGMDKIDSESNRAKDDIHTRFDLLMRNIQKQKESLLRNVDEIKQTKKQILNEQIDSFRTHRNEILAAKKKYDENLAQITDVQRRKAKNIKLCANVLTHRVFSTHRNNKTKMNVIPFVDVMFDNANDDIFVHNIAEIDENHRPLVPKMLIKIIDSDFAIIEWTVDHHSMQQREHSCDTIDSYIPYERYNITEFEIQTAQTNHNKETHRKTNHRKQAQRKRNVTVHVYDEYSDEEKEHSISQKKQDTECVLEWQTVAMITNENNKNTEQKWSYTLRNLYKNSEYFVRIQSWNELGGNSAFCKGIRFKTLCRKQQEKLEWCLEPFSLNKYDLNMKGLQMYCNGENNRVQIFNKAFCKLIVNYNIIKWPYNKFIWCFELHVISNCSWLGFIENPIHQNISSWSNWLGNESCDYSIGINSVNRQCFPYAKSKSISPLNLLEIPKPNDKIYFIIDLVKSNCQIYHNNYNLGVVFANIPLDVVPAISNGEAPMDCTVSFKTAL